MPDRVHHHPNLIYSLGTQVVTLAPVLGESGKVLLWTGIYPMKRGEVQANMGRLNERFKLPYLPELIERKVGGTEKGRLVQAYQESKLPEAPSGAAALHDLLVRIRLGNIAR